MCGYEEYISAQHAAFEGYRDETVAKWDAKLRLASGKLTNKVCMVLQILSHRHIMFPSISQAFVQVDRSTLAQIKHVSNGCYLRSALRLCCQAGAPGQRSSGETNAVEEISLSRSGKRGRGSGGGDVT